MMDLNFTTDEMRFRDEVRAFLQDALPDEICTRILNGHSASSEDIRAWQRILHARGWGAPSWPVQFGGTGWSLIQQYLFELECAEAGAPAQLAFGVKMIAPVLMRFGSPAQQKFFLPQILNGEHWWCQGYSEPGAGSDLAALATRARREGEDYIVDGQKAWNTLGQYADWIFCLVRTDPAAKPQRGISFLLIDMKSPGITVRPTTLLDGTREVNEIWFEQVRVPVSNRVGEENQGWTYAKFLLGHERTNIAGAGVSRRYLARLKRIAAVENRHGRQLLQDPLFRARVAQIEIDLLALEMTNLRVISDSSRRQSPGPEASILKIRGTEIQQALSEMLVESVGIGALPFAEVSGPVRATVTAEYLNLRKLSIFGGSNEIQRNILAQKMLDL